MNIYVIFIYTFIFVILKSSNCSDQYPGYSTPDDTEDEDNNFDVSQSGQPHEQQYQPPTPHTTQPQPTQPEPVTYPGIQYPVYQPQPQKPYPGYQPVPYEQPQPYIPYQPPQPDQPYQPPPQPTQQILVTYPGIQYPGYQPYGPYQQHYQPPPIPEQSQYYPGHEPTQIKDPTQILEEYDQLADKLISDAKDKVFKKQKELDFIKLYKKSKKGKLVLMTENDYRKVFSNMFVTKYKLKSELEMLICNADTVYIHKTGNAYCTSITYNKKTNCFILTRNDGFLYIKLDDGRWRLKYRSFPDYVKLYTHDSYGNDVELNDEFYYLELTSKGSFKYRIKDDIRCTKIIVKQMLVWKQRDLDEPFPNVISVTIKMNVVLHYENYVIIYGIVRRQFKRLYIKPNKAGFNEY